MRSIALGFFALLALVTAAMAAPDKWYEGGTLSNATPTQWKGATQRNKLATCADFLAQLWLEKKLKPEVQRKIKSMDDLKPYCERLRREIDDALRDSKETPRVPECVAAIILLSGWVE